MPFKMYPPHKILYWKPVFSIDFRIASLSFVPIETYLPIRNKSNSRETEKKLYKILEFKTKF
jgi:hypothetical protein